MVLNNINQIFSKMEWLDELIDRNSKSEGRNKKSDFYYKNLSEIREKQRKGIMPLDEYKNVGRQESIEYGYYMANIHYDLYECDKSKKDILEDRIIFFLNNAPKEIFEYEDSWFKLNFYYEYSYYLRKYYDDLETNNHLEDYVYKYNNKREKEILIILADKGII